LDGTFLERFINVDWRYDIIAFHLSLKDY
jgi:hypothetical protein